VSAPRSAGGLRWRLIAGAIVLAVGGIFVGANAHLIYVAFASQPDCVPHATGPGGGPAPYRAAKPAC
jgi:hypothetical protein